VAGEVNVSAHAQHIDHLDIPAPLRAPRLQTVALALLVVGLAAFAFLLVSDRQRAWSAFLQASLIPTWVGIGAMFYIAVHSAANAKWNIPIRRLLEGLTSGLLVTLPAVIALALFGGHWLYDWVHLPAGSVDHQNLFHVHGSKESVMTEGRWVVTNVCIVLVWLFFRMKLVGFSTSQDADRADIRQRHARWSIAFLIVFALSFTVYVWDNLLALHRNWFSTMWGPYCFTSAVQSMLCVLVLLMLWLRRGPMRQHIQEHTLHDVGTWMVGWSCFCAYLGFSQFMLIWYANLDEETFFYVIRTQHGYGEQYAIEALIRWPLCFLGLMSQSVRTKPWALATVAVAVLIGNWMDWSWIIQPAFSQNAYRCPFEWQELALGAGFLGAFLLVVLRFYAKHGLIPKGESRLLPIMNAEHLH